MDRETSARLIADPRGKPVKRDDSERLQALMAIDPGLGPEARTIRISRLAGVHDQWLAQWAAKTSPVAPPADEDVPSQYAEGGTDADCTPEADSDLVRRLG